MKRVKPPHSPHNETLAQRLIESLQGHPLQWTVIAIVGGLLLFGAWNKFRTPPVSPSPSGPQNEPETGPTRQPVTEGQVDRDQVSVSASRPSGSFGPVFSASAPIMNSKTEMDWSSGHYAVLKSAPNLIHLRSHNAVELTALKSEITVSRCTFSPKQACARIQGRQVLVTPSLKEKLPASLSRRSPWDGPITKPQ